MATKWGDILIGADGIRSCGRQVMAPDAPQPDYTGLLNLGGGVRNSGLERTPNTMRMVWGRRAFFGWTVRPDGEASTRRAHRRYGSQAQQVQGARESHCAVPARPDHARGHAPVRNGKSHVLDS